ncbi:hypothetical protein NQZ68_041864 [Dissostichus eleginoides]|nr:hypothetical protein NQZ68_041864 [Dissostichus eleginoides]
MQLCKENRAVSTSSQPGNPQDARSLSPSSSDCPLDQSQGLPHPQTVLWTNPRVSLILRLSSGPITGSPSSSDCPLDQSQALPHPQTDLWTNHRVSEFKDVHFNVE